MSQRPGIRNLPVPSTTWAFLGALVFSEGPIAEIRIADEAPKRGIPFAGHVPSAVTAAEASGAGQKSIEHLTQVAAGCARQDDASIARRSAARAKLLARAPAGGPGNQYPRYVSESLALKITTTISLKRCSLFL